MGEQIITVRPRETARLPEGFVTNVGVLPMHFTFSETPPRRSAVVKNNRVQR